VPGSTPPSVAAPGTLRGRDLLSAGDLAPAEVRRVFATAAALKAEFLVARRHDRPPLVRRTLAMLFERPSLRTRVTFEAGMVQLGGAAIELTSGNIGWGVRESIADVARNLQGFVDAIVIRTGPQATAQEFADRAAIPVINALTLHEHPCQALADVFTVREAFDSIDGRVIAFVGDGNNVFHSLALAAAGQGATIRLAHPRGYGPDPAVILAASTLAASTGAKVELGTDPRAAVDGADVIYTDAWTSMGQEAETEQRRAAFAAYQVNAELLAVAGPDARVMHCLPAHRGEEITSDVMDGPQSLVFAQSENRLHVQKGLLVEILGSGDAGPAPGASSDGLQTDRRTSA
jgi:ornithine carbamoyltransferase